MLCSLCPQVAFQVRFEPFGHVEDFSEEHLIHLDATLDAQVASLTESRKVPLFAVAFDSVEMVNREHMTAFDIMGMTAPLAFPSSFGFDAIRDLLPVLRVVAHTFGLKFSRT